MMRLIVAILKHLVCLGSVQAKTHSCDPKFRLSSVEFSEILDSTGALGPWKLLDFVREDVS